ncbi:MAG: dihydroorotase [Bacteroidales bacterium]|jgi:dihydroorotase|nr:dihydroorotase [Bacteroidales bacterium]
MQTLIKNATIVNEGKKIKSDLLIKGNRIVKIGENITFSDFNEEDIIIDAEGLWLLPGVIDDQVHFREPGLTHKADIYSESRAAAAGGVTSYMEMPNTYPPAVNMKLLIEKFEIAEKKSAVNYSFFLGATNENIEEIKNVDKQTIAGIKMFLGSSTGNMLVDKSESIRKILSESPVIVAAHCEDDNIIKYNLEKYENIYGEDIPVKFHPAIRSEEACYSSSSKVVKIAEETGGRLHIFHLSTEKELELLSDKPLKSKKVTAEVCVHHLWFNDGDYDRLGTKIKWNPAVKKESDRLALIRALKDGKIDIVATDHAPHTIEEKDNVYVSAPSGAPMVQHSLLAMIELSKQGYFSVEEIVKWMSHNPAELYDIDSRGFIREGYYADLVLVDPDSFTKVEKNNLFYKCGWSPLEGVVFNSKIKTTFVNGKIVYNDGRIIEANAAMKLDFKRTY